MASSDACKPRRVVLTTDCGADMDDQWALAHLALSPEVELRAIVTTHSPTFEAPSAEVTARCAREVLDQLPVVCKTPIFVGSSVKLEDRAKPYPNAGVERIIEESRAHSAQDRLALLSIGAATDVASALLLDPTLAERIEIIAMGFLGWPEGGVEFNINNDVKAWQVLLDSDVPLAVGDQAVCKQDLLLTPEEAAQVLAETGPAGDYLVKLLADYIAEHPMGQGCVPGRPNAWPVWDSVTVGHLLGLSRCADYPRPELTEAMQFIHPVAPTGRTLRWITAIDSARLWADLAAKLKAGLASSAVKA